MRISLDTWLAARIHRGHIDGDLDRCVTGLVSHPDHPGQAGEPAADLGQHEVTADEGQLGVARVDLPPVSGRKVGPVGEARDGSCGFGLGHEVLPLKMSVRTHIIYVLAHTRNW
jgi:hypothetical protein